MKIIIFDIDGTLANLNHRLHLVKNGNRKWNEFFAAAKDDLPIPSMVELMHCLSPHYGIILVSGRSESIRGITEKWLYDQGELYYHGLYMRPVGDYRKDFIVKKEILAQIRKDYDDPEILFVVDDRPSVVKMWREEGLTCLQCAEWEEKGFLKDPSFKKGLLTLMVGPSGAGKSMWLGNTQAQVGYIHEGMIISSDAIRHELCGDFRNQAKNDQVFKALRDIVVARIENGLSTIVDATNIKRADRLSITELAKGGDVRYIVIDRPLEVKLRDAGWRAEVPGLIERHHQTFQAQLKDILKGDKLPNVTVVDLRTK